MYWWKGQNQRTFQIGLFPRCLVDPMRKKQGEDISKPLQNSFIHTGKNIWTVVLYFISESLNSFHLKVIILKEMK